MELAYKGHEPTDGYINQISNVRYVAEALYSHRYRRPLASRDLMVSWLGYVYVAVYIQTHLGISLFVILSRLTNIMCIKSF